MHEESSFITLTISDDHIGDNVLRYRDFQLFIKRLRKHIEKESHGQTKISVLCAGEYGDRTKRSHWHCLVFGWKPKDLRSPQTNHEGDPVYASDTLDKIWGKGITATGDVTLKSAGYCARYALKKLQHGPDQNNRYAPISRRSSKNAIGKKWIEKFWPDCFNKGYITYEGKKFPIPRYYERWLQKHHPSAWRHYVTEVKPKIIKEAIQKEEKISLREKIINAKRSGLKGLQISRNQVRNKILELKGKKLKEQKI